MAGALTNLGPIHRSGSRSQEDGHRDYTIRFLVSTTDPYDGPQYVTFAAGLPRVGEPWAYGSDFDPGAFCTPYIGIQPHSTDQDPVLQWVLEYKFTSRPMKNCSEQSYDNPIMRPDKISGSFVERKIKVTKDINGFVIKTIAFETIEIEEDKAYPTVRIEQYDSQLRLRTFSRMINGLNRFSLWGLPPRTIKLSNVAWEKNQFGTCFNYYTRQLEFQINTAQDNKGNVVGWDRADIPHKGTKVLRGQHVHNKVDDTYTYQKDSGADINNPQDYITYKDPQGNPTDIFLNPKTGLPSETEVLFNPIKLRQDHNFLELGIPTTLS